MKNLFIIAFLFLSLSMSAQTIYNLDKKKDTTTIKTADIAIYQGKKLPVYKSARGKLFIYVVSKKGKVYKKYLN